MTDQERFFAVDVISASWFKFLDTTQDIHMKKVNGRQLTNSSERTIEMKPNKICKRSFIMAMALAAVFALAAAWPRTAAAAGPAECGLIGTWSGDAGNDLRWLGVHTPGSTISRGEMALHWVRVSTLILTGNNQYLGATRLSDGHGVWEQTRKGEYKYAWYAYGIGPENEKALFSVRVSGTALNTNQGDESVNPCDSVLIYFTYEMFAGFVLPQEMYVDPLDPLAKKPYATITAAASEKRVPLTVVPWEGVAP